jgi:hypothetical protein
MNEARSVPVGASSVRSAAWARTRAINAMNSGISNVSWSREAGLKAASA